MPELKSRSTLAFRGIGFVFTLAASCGLATLHWERSELPNTAGGVLGALVGESLAGAFSFLGATLLMLGLWLAGVSLFLGVSWLTVMDRLGHWTLRGFGWLRNAPVERARGGGRARTQAGARGDHARGAEEIRRRARRRASSPW